MTNHTQIDKGKTAIQFDNSRVSRGQKNNHDRPAHNRTPVGGKVHQRAVYSQDRGSRETVPLGGYT